MSFVDVLAQLWSEWGLRISVFLSLSANVLLSLLSGTRQRSASGWWAVLLWFVTRIVLWMAYQGAEITATGAVGSLSLCGSDASAEEQVVIAFWAPFLLLHLGGPDTMTAYAPEDNAMSVRKFAEMVFHIWGAFYVLYKYIFRVRSWTLLATASVIMLLVGAVRYVEKWYALWQSKSMMEDDGDDDDSSKKKKKKKKKEEEDAWSSSEPELAGAGSTCTISSKEVEEKLHDDDEALRLAQDLFHVCRRALADSSVVPGSEKQHASEKIFKLGWESMCKVVEMELSLMYEALYTKAIVLHTWPTAGYLIRLLSPLATAAAVFLFNQYMGSRPTSTRDDIVRGSFLKVTYLLLGFALAMDVVWLLRALGSTWTSAALKDKAAEWPWSSHWLRHHLLCSGRWSRLHLVVEYPVQWLFCRDHPVVSCRTWSGTIGRYNLLHECCAGAAPPPPPPRPPRRRPPLWRRFYSWLKKKWDWLKKKWDRREGKYLCELPHDVKKLLIERVRRILYRTIHEDEDNPKKADGDEHDDGYTLVDIRTLWGQQALNQNWAKELFLVEGKKEEEEDKDAIAKRRLKFGQEFEEDVLMWHMATCVFLSRYEVRIPASSTDHVKAIEAMSEYLMFFVAIRQHMLPGLVLHSLFEKTLQALGEIWEEGKDKITGSNNTLPKDTLADILLEKARNEKLNLEWFLDDDGRLLVRDAAVVAGKLIGAYRRQQKRQRVPQLLEFIFNVWVDKLLYAAVRCSRESHAKQLSRGGDLTTILWMILQHAGLFRVGEKRPRYVEPIEKKKKKKPEEKKPQPPSWAPPYGWYDGVPPTTQMPPEEPQMPPEEAEERDEDDDGEHQDLPTGYITVY